MNATPFHFTLGQRLAIVCSGEPGAVVGRSESLDGEPQYLLRYRAADGRAVEAWWAQSALERTEFVALAPDRAIAQPATLIPPPIGRIWTEQGGIYAGIARGVDGAPDHHLLLCGEKPATDLAWQPAIDWAEALQWGNFTDWHLPTRDESALLYANLRGEFEGGWHWTSTQYSRDYAWVQVFDGGYQDGGDKSYEARARAVRRLVIQSFSHS